MDKKCVIKTKKQRYHNIIINSIITILNYHWAVFNSMYQITLYHYKQLIESCLSSTAGNEVVPIILALLIFHGKVALKLVSIQYFSTQTIL